MKVFRKIILILLTIVVMFFLYITISFAYQKIVLKKVPYVFGYTSFINTGSSMLPYINVGDLVIVKKENSYKVNPLKQMKILLILIELFQLNLVTIKQKVIVINLMMVKRLIKVKYLVK